MSKAGNHLAPTLPQTGRPVKTLPLPHFRERVAALGPDEVLQLRSGDIAIIADAIGNDRSSITRAIGSPELKADIAEVVGVPVERIRLPGKGGWPKGRVPGWRKGRKNGGAET